MKFNTSGRYLISPAKITFRLLILVYLHVSISTFADEPLIIFYKKPATNWAREALLIGNGRLGGMIFGNVFNERIQFNEDSLWTGDENPSGNYETMGAYQNFGDLFIEFTPGNPNHTQVISNYSRALNISSAICTTTFTVDNIVHRREYFASHPDQVIVFRWTADKPNSISGAIKLKGAHNEKTHITDSTLSFEGKFTNRLEYCAIAKVITSAGRIITNENYLKFENCNELIVILGAKTSYTLDYSKGWMSSNPGPALLDQVNSAASKQYKELLERHTSDYQSLFNRVKVNWGTTDPKLKTQPTDVRIRAVAEEINDPELEAILFQFGRYLLISSSRRPGLPANLQGLWNDSNTPAWASDYHSNINIEMNYWPAEPANLSECHLPFFDLVLEMREPCRKATKAAFGNVRGWTLRTSHNIFGGLGWKWNIPANAWYALHFWEHFSFTRDTNFLRQIAYPMMKEVCQFWEDYLKRLPDGTLVVPNGWSPEHGPREDGVSHDQQIVWDLFTNFIEASQILDSDQEYRNKIIQMRSKLAGPKIGKWGQLQEWMIDRDDPNDQHRHTSHLFAVYPGRQITDKYTPELAQAARISLIARGTSGDSRREWVWAWRCALWARLHDGENAYKMIQYLFRYNTLPNLLGNHPPMQMDGNFGITAAICEMLIQSHTDEIELLPAIPRAWENGQVKGLMARGNIQVDLQWQNNKLSQITLLSKWPNECKIRYQNKSTTVSLPPGTPVKLTYDDAFHIIKN